MHRTWSEAADDIAGHEGRWRGHLSHRQLEIRNGRICKLDRSDFDVDRRYAERAIERLRPLYMDYMGELRQLASDDLAIAAAPLLEKYEEMP